MNPVSRILTGAAARVERLVRSVRGPETSRLADVPGVTHYGQGPDEATRKTLESWGVYSSRVAPSAGPTRSRWSLWPGDGLTPETIIGAQREAVTSGIPLRWVELLDQIHSRDGHYAAVTNQRVEDVIKGSWRLTRAASDDAGTAMRNFAAEAYGQCSRWRDGLGWLLYSNLFGYSSFEVEWYETRVWFPGPKGETIGPVDVVLPRRLHNVHPKHFRFDLESDDPRFWIGNSYQPLPFGKFVFLDGEGLHPTKVRRGHGWQCIWYSLFRSTGWAAWAVHVDRFSLPVPLIEYEGDIAQYQEYKDAYDDILNSLGEGKGAILPKGGASFNIKDPPAGGRSSDPASALSDACDAGQSIRVLGATLTTKIGNVGSFAASSSHAEVKYAKEEGDAGRMWERIDEQLTHPLILFNAEPLAKALRDRGYDVTPELLMRRVPRGKHRVPRESDPLVEMQIADYAVNKLSLPLSEEGMLDRIDFPRATSPEDRVKGEPQVVAKGGALVPNATAAEQGGVKNEDPAAQAQADALNRSPTTGDAGGEEGTPGDGPKAARGADVEE
jgi:phage gp29-like protein